MTELTSESTQPAYLTSNNILNMVKPLFRKVYENDSDQEEEEDYVYVFIAQYEEELDRYENSTDLIPNLKSITIEYDYPLNVPARKTFERPSNGFTQRQLIALICKGYHEVYKEESETSTVPAHNPNSLLMNRGRTNGKYGIWGHDLEDLVLHTLVYHSGDVFGIEVDSLPFFNL